MLHNLSPEYLESEKNHLIGCTYFFMIVTINSFYFYSILLETALRIKPKKAKQTKP
jgi:hypothetical protein